jgi:uncharacterized Zn finger protein (UPF0148 family)
MKKIDICKICGGAIIQAGNGNVFCEDCADRDFSVRLQEWADRNESRRIAQRRNAKS